MMSEELLAVNEGTLDYDKNRLAYYDNWEKMNSEWWIAASKIAHELIPDTIDDDSKQESSDSLFERSSSDDNGNDYDEDNNNVHAVKMKVEQYIYEEVSKVIYNSNNNDILPIPFAPNATPLVQLVQYQNKLPLSSPARAAASHPVDSNNKSMIGRNTLYADGRNTQENEKVVFPPIWTPLPPPAFAHKNNIKMNNNVDNDNVERNKKVEVIDNLYQFRKGGYVQFRNYVKVNQETIPPLRDVTDKDEFSLGSCGTNQKHSYRNIVPKNGNATKDTGEKMILRAVDDCIPSWDDGYINGKHYKSKHVNLEPETMFDKLWTDRFEQFQHYLKRGRISLHTYRKYEDDRRSWTGRYKKLQNYATSHKAWVKAQRNLYRAHKNGNKK